MMRPTQAIESSPGKRGYRKMGTGINSLNDAWQSGKNRTQRQWQRPSGLLLPARRIPDVTRTLHRWRLAHRWESPNGRGRPYFAQRPRAQLARWTPQTLSDL